MFSIILPVIRDLLREKLAPDFLPEAVQVCPDGRPYPFAGQRFIAVYGSTYDAGPDREMQIGLDVILGFTCTITFRTPVVPLDRVGDSIYIELFSGLEDVSRKLIAILDYNYAELTTAVNRRFEELGREDRLIEPFYWRSTSPAPVLVGVDWFYGAPGDVVSFEHDQSGAYLNVEFYGGRVMGPTGVI